MFGASEDPLHALVLERGRRAIDDADLLVFVVDGREGLVPGDADIARLVRESNKPALLAINKTDDKRARAGAIEFYQLGFDATFEISAEHGEGTGDLLDAIVASAGPVRAKRTQPTTTRNRRWRRGPHGRCRPGPAPQLRRRTWGPP